MLSSLAVCREICRLFLNLCGTLRLIFFRNTASHASVFITYDAKPPGRRQSGTYFMPFHRSLHLCLSLNCRPAVCLSLTSPFRFLSVAILPFPCTAAFLFFLAPPSLCSLCVSAFLLSPCDTAFEVFVKRNFLGAGKAI